MSRRLVFFVFVSLMVLLAVVEVTANTNHEKQPNRTSSEKPTGAADTLAAPLILQLAGTLFPLLLHKLF